MSPEKPITIDSKLSAHLLIFNFRSLLVWEEKGYKLDSPCLTSSSLTLGIMEGSHTCRYRAFCALNLICCKKACCLFMENELTLYDDLLLLARDCKYFVDRYGLEYDILFPIFRFLKELYEKNSMEDVPALKYLYFKKNLKFLGQTDFLLDYVSFVKPRLKSCVDASEAESMVRKCFKVYHLVRLNGVAIEADQYKFVESLLVHCYNYDIQDSQLVVDILKALIEWYAKDIRYIPNKVYSQEFFEFILRHTIRARFDLGYYLQSNPRRLSLYSRNFSIANAVGLGNVPKLKALLQNGFQILSEMELKRSGHGYPYLEEIMPQSHLMILQMMCSMMSVNRLILKSTNTQDIGLYAATNDQMKCFRLIWRAIPDAYVRQMDIMTSVFDEYSILNMFLVFNPARYERNLKLSVMYETCFPDLAHGPKQPRSLQHLCRCSIRKRLQETWSLPFGISQLDLPNLLQEYLNLERD